MPKMPGRVVVEITTPTRDDLNELGKAWGRDLGLDRLPHRVTIAKLIEFYRRQSKDGAA